jgi:cytochrome P450 family 6
MKATENEFVETSVLVNEKFWQLQYHGLLSGSTVEVKETMARFTTDVIASCAFGINGNSLKDPDSEFGRSIRNIFDFSVMKGLAILLAHFAPSINRIFRLKFVEDKTNNYLRQVVWNTVEYR